jgi:hypothetical protein
MIDLKLTDDGDLAIENGDLVLIDGADTTAQLLRVRGKFLRGEWFADPDVGFPFDEILGEKPDLGQVEIWLRQMITETPGVESVSELDVQLDDATRELRVSGEVTYTTGERVPIAETLRFERGV